jgi:iron complex transport system substrate-binding protein
VVVGHDRSYGGLRQGKSRAAWAANRHPSRILRLLPVPGAIYRYRGYYACPGVSILSVCYIRPRKDSVADTLIVGISGYVVRPPLARREKPRVSAFTSTNIDKILALKPDLVLTFCDLQADIVADLIGRGLDVHALNQRRIAGILDMIRTLGAMVDATERARQLVETLETRLAEVRSRGERLPRRPRIFFEEWEDPLISGIGWVSELVEIAGGIDIFADHRNQGAAKDRVVTVEEVVAREPDLIIGSWCGKKFRPERVAARPCFGQIPALLYQDLYEIKSSLILQPGQAALTDGLAELQKIIGHWVNRC